MEVLLLLYQRQRQRNVTIAHDTRRDAGGAKIVEATSVRSIIVFSAN